MFNINKEILTKNIAPLLFGMMGALIIQVGLSFNQKPSIATVNITGMVASFIKETASQNITEAQKKQRITQFGAMMQKAIDDTAYDKHVIIFPSEAVIAGSKDLSRDVMIAIKKGMRA